MAHFYVGSNGSIHREKTKKEKEQIAARAKKQAATELKQARSNYQNYVSGERNRIISNQNKRQFDTGASLSDRLAPIDQLKQKQQERRTKQQEQNDYNRFVSDRLQQNQNKIRYGADELPRNNQISRPQNQFEQQVSKNTAALKQASQTQQAKELKKDMRIKQNEYNYANYLENQAKVAQEKTTTLDKIVNPITSGLGELTDFSRLTGTQDVYDYETGKKTFLPNRREIKQQKVRKDSKGAWGYYNDLSYNFSKAVGAKILDSVTFGGGTALYYGNLAKDGVQEARQLGYSKNESLAYGTTLAVIAGTLDKTLNSFGGLSGKQLFGLKVPTLTEGVDKMFTKALGNKAASTLFSNITREAASEFIEEFADNTAKYAINADKSDYDSFMDMIAKTLPDALYSAFVGAGSGAVGRIAERNTVDMQERLKALDDYKATLEGIQPQSIPEAQYKEDRLAQVDNQINEINTQIEQNQTAPNTTEQVQTQSQQKETTSQEKDVSERKEQQFKEIQKTNKMTDDQHVGIRKSSDIKTAEEAFKTTVNEDEDYLYPDFTQQDGEKALKNGKVTVYSSKPIEQGGFVSPSKQMAQDYAGNGEVYSQEVNINDVAWIDSNEGQYAVVPEKNTQEQVSIKPTEDVKKQGQLQMIFSEETNKTIKQTEKVAKEINLPKKQTQHIVDTYKNIDRIQNNQPSTNYIEGNVTYGKDGISTKLDEKMVNEVIKINEPNKYAQTITLKANGEEIKVKKPSPELAKKDIREQLRHYSETLTGKDKMALKKELDIKTRDFEAAKQDAIKNKNPKALAFFEELGRTEQYKSIDISSEVLNKSYVASKDVDAFREKVQNQYIEDTIGSKDGTTPTRAGVQDVSNIEGLFLYDLTTGNIDEAKEDYKLCKRYATQSSQTMNQIKALYQMHPLGIWLQFEGDMDTAFEETAKRKGVKWREKNDPNRNKKSKYYVSPEESKYVLEKSMELYELHATDYETYNVKKGELQQYIGDRIPKSVADQITDWIRHTLLMGPRAILRNIETNVIDISVHAPTKAIYTAIDKSVSKKYNTNQRTSAITIDGSLAGIKAAASTSLKTGKIAFYNLLHGTSISTEFSNKFVEGSESRENVTKDFYNTMPSRYQTTLKPVDFIGNRLSQLSNDAMSWGDAPFAAASYANNLESLRYANALLQHQSNPTKSIVYKQEVDNTGTTHLTYITPEGTISTDLVQNPNKYMKENNMEMLKRIKDIDKMALNYSEKRTYTGDTPMSKETSALIDRINKFFSKVPGFKQTGIKPASLTVVYSKIGANLVYKGYRGSFLAFPSMKESFNKFKAELEANEGKVSYETQNDFVTRAGDIVFGTMAYFTLGATAIALFNAEGGEDEDDKKKSAKVKKFMNTIFGKDEYTFKIGDKNIKFDVGGNLTDMLKMSLDLTEETIKQYKKQDLDVKKYIEIGIGDLISEWTVSNITDLFKTEYDNNVWSNIWSSIARLPSMTIPSVMKDIAMQVDDFTERQVWDEDIGKYALNSIKAKIPVWRGTLPAKTDSWGNVMKSGSDMFSQYWNNYVSTGMIKQEKTDGVSQELMKMYMTTKKSEVIPNSYEKSFSYKNKKYKLNEKEEQKYLKTYAQTAYNKLDKLFYSKEYQESDTSTKLEYIKEVYKYANDKAKKEYLAGKNIDYYNYGQKVFVVGENIQFKQATILDAIDNNISYEAAKKYQEDPNKFKLYNSFGSYEYYRDATNNIKDIRDTYKKENGYSDSERKNQVVNYVSSLNNLSAVQKAILIKEYYPTSYTNYNSQIKEYLQKQNLDVNTYTELVNKYKLNYTKPTRRKRKR